MDPYAYKTVIGTRAALVTTNARFCGAPVNIVCDMRCSKAFGINARPKHYYGDEDESPDDYAWLADDEVGDAPEDPGSYEGGDGKPLFDFEAHPPEVHNKWCARECERCEIIDAEKPLQLCDFSRRVNNMKWRDEQ